MGEGTAPFPDDDPLVVWALASFHTATLTALPVTALYLDGALGGLLAGFGTGVGLGLYLALWAGTWWTTRQVLRELADGDPDAGSLVAVGTGAKWGGADGIYFFWVLLAVFVALNLPREPVAVLDIVPVFLFAWAVGSVLAAGVGGIVGGLFAALDVALARAAAGLAPAGER